MEEEGGSDSSGDGSNYYDDIKMIYQQSDILPIVISSTSVLFYQLKNKFQLRDALLFQIAFLIALILSNIFMYIKVTNHFSLSPSEGKKESTSESLLASATTTTELCYVPIFLALIVLSVTSDINNRGRNKIRFIINVAMQSLVPASLSFAYTMLFLSCMERQRQHNDNNKKFNANSAANVSYIVLVFVFSWTFLTMWMIKDRRRHLIIKSSPSLLPSQYNMNSSRNNDNFLDENQWKQWTNDNLLSWIKVLYEKQEKLQNLQSESRYSRFSPGSRFTKSNLGAKNNADIHLDKINDEIILHILETFQKQGINGSFLPYIQVQDLVRMGIHYCHAVHLCVHFHALMGKSQFLNKDGTDTIQGGEVGIDLDKWLGKKIGGGSGSNTVSDAVTTDVTVDGASSTSAHSNQESDVHTGLQGNSSQPSPQYEHVKKMMSDRYGIELPELRQPSNDHNIQASSIPTQVQAQPPMHASTTFNNVASMKSEHSNRNTDIDPALLEVMPPNIREIASRRPDLVEAIHKKFLTGGSDEQVAVKSTSRPRVVRFEMDQSNGPHEEEGNGISQHTGFVENSDKGSSINNVDYEVEGMDEMVGLLRRRRVKHP